MNDAVSITDADTVTVVPTESAGDLRYRRLRVSDVPAIDRVQALVYDEGFYESPEAFQSKLELPQNFSVGAWRDGDLIGYLIAFPWHSAVTVPLNSTVSPASDANCVYFHDLAVIPNARGHGVGGDLINHVLDAARSDFPLAVLVAIEGAAPLWSTYGFEPTGVADPSYGAGAVKMHRTL